MKEQWKGRAAVRAVLKKSLGYLAAVGLVCWTASAMAQPKELVFSGFGGSMQKALQSTVIPAFEKQFDAKVIYVSGTSNQILAKVRAQKKHPQIDVIWANDTTHFQGKQEGLYEKLDPKIVTHLPDLYDFARDPDGVGVVMGIQSLSLEYNTQVFKEKGWDAPTSWLDLWDEKYKGHVVAYNMPIGYTNLLLVEIAKLTGGSENDLQPAWDKFAELVPNALAFVTPPAQVDALFGSGAAWIAFNGSTRINDLIDRGAPVALANPKEGSILYPQQFDIVVNAPHPELAQQFVNFALSEEAQKMIAQSMLLGPVNKNVKLDAAEAAKVPYGEKEATSLLRFNMAPVNGKLAELTARWTEMVGKR